MTFDKFHQCFLLMIKIDAKKRHYDFILLIFSYFILAVTLHLLSFSTVYTHQEINKDINNRLFSVTLTHTEDGTNFMELMDAFDIEDYRISSDNRQTTYEIEMSDYRELDSFVEKVNRVYDDVNYRLPSSVDTEAMKKISLLLISFLLLVIIINTVILILVTLGIFSGMRELMSLLSILGYRKKTIINFAVIKVILVELFAFLISYLIFTLTYGIFNAFIIQVSNMTIDSHMKIQHLNQMIVFTVSIIVTLIIFTVKSKSINQALTDGVEGELC